MQSVEHGTITWPTQLFWVEYIKKQKLMDARQVLDLPDDSSDVDTEYVFG